MSMANFAELYGASNIFVKLLWTLLKKNCGPKNLK